MSQPTKTADYGVFIDTAFNQVACIGTAEQFDNGCFVFTWYAAPPTGVNVIVTPIEQRQPVKLELVK